MLIRPNPSSTGKWQASSIKKTWAAIESKQ